MYYMDMRYCNKTKEIINSSYKSATIEEIVAILKSNNLRERSESSLRHYIDRLNQRDQKREIRRKNMEKWALNNPIKYRARTLVNGAKQRAKKKNIPFNLTNEWVEEKLRNSLCEITGTPFYIKPYSIRSEYTKVHPHSPSLDQISPSGGYTMENVQVVCDQVNKFKGDRHVASMVIVAKNFLKEYNKRNTPVIRI